MHIHLNLLPQCGGHTGLCVAVSGISASLEAKPSNHSARSWGKSWMFTVQAGHLGKWLESSGKTKPLLFSVRAYCSWIRFSPTNWVWGNGLVEPGIGLLLSWGLESVGLLKHDELLDDIRWLLVSILLASFWRLFEYVWFPFCCQYFSIHYNKLVDKKEKVTFNCISVSFMWFGGFRSGASAFAGSCIVWKCSLSSVVRERNIEKESTIRIFSLPPPSLGPWLSF